MSDPIGDDVLILDRDFIVKTAKKFREEHEMAEMEPIKVEMDLTYRTVAVSRMYKDGSIVRKEEADEDIIEVVCPPRDVPMAEVGLTSSLTLNLGNFESVKIGVSISLPSTLPELDEAFKAAKKFIDGKLNTEVSDIREYRKKRATE